MHLYVAEDELILLKLRIQRRGKSMSKTVEELIMPEFTALNQSNQDEQSRRLSNISARIVRKYETEEERYRKENPIPGPHPFMGVSCLLPQELITDSDRFAAAIGSSTEEFLSAILEDTFKKQS